MRQGNPGKRALNRSEAQVEGDAPVRAPAWLGEGAKKEWQRLRKRLQAAGLLTALDGDVLALYCQAHARWVEAEAQLQRIGPVVKTKNGSQVL